MGALHEVRAADAVTPRLASARRTDGPSTQGSIVTTQEGRTRKLSRPSLYELKKSVLLPRTLYRRHRERDMDPSARIMFELHYYRRPMYDFLGATMANPDILVDVEVDEESIVLDVGAFVGHWAEKISDRYGSRVYAFEPADAGVEKMRGLFADRPNVEVFDYGLGRENLTVALALAGPGSSIYAETAPWGFAEVEIRDIVEVLDELGIEHIDLLKVNIEGGEFDLFDRVISSGWLPRIDQILIQFHEWHPNAYLRRRQIRRALRQHHEEVWDFPWVWEYWRRPG